MSVATSMSTPPGAPPEARTQVAELELQPVDGVAPPRPVPARPLRRGLAREVCRVQVTPSLTLAGFGEAILAELADRLEQAVPRAGGGVVGDDERLADERVEVPQHVDLVGVVDDRAHAREVEAAGEHRRDAQQRSLVVGQQVVRPLDRVAQCELTLRARRVALQQAEPVGESIPDLHRAHRRHPCRGQLDAQWQSVDGLADLSHRGRGRRILELEVRTDRSSPVDEELSCVGGHASVERQRRHRRDRFGRHPERLARRRHDPHVSGSPEDRLDRARRRAHDVLAVVGDEQHVTPGERVGDRVDQRHVSLRRDAQHRRQRGRDHTRITHPCQFNDPDPVRELGGHLSADLEGQPRLADAAHAGQRDQPVGPHQLGDLADQRLAPDERTELAWQVAGEVVDTAQDGELRRDPFGHHLEYSNPAAQPTQQVLAQRAQGDTAAHEKFGGVGHEHLTAVAEGHQSRRPVHLGAEVGPVALDRLTRVHPHPNREGDGVVGAQLSLRLNRSGDRVRGRGERDAEAVSARGEHVAVVPLDRRANDGVVNLQRGGHVGGRRFPESCRVLDVGEQERHRSRRWLHGHSGTVTQAQMLEPRRPVGERVGKARNTREQRLRTSLGTEARDCSYLLCAGTCPRNAGTGSSTLRLKHTNPSPTTREDGRAPNSTTPILTASRPRRRRVWGCRFVLLPRRCRGHMGDRIW